MTAEEQRTRLIGEIARVLRDGPVPDEARAAALTFIGWLARRMPGEPVSRCDLSQCKGHAREATYTGPQSGLKPRGSFIVSDADGGHQGTRPRTAR
jgi:glucose-6-phosphate dehydrogenase assembly protein OpcA